MTIKEVAEKYDITPDTLRYYERVGLLNNVPRNPNGIRNYDETSCKRIEFIKCMRSAGMPVEVLITYMDLFKQGKNTVPKRIVIRAKRSFNEKARRNKKNTRKIRL